MRWCMMARIDRETGARVSYVANGPSDIGENEDEDADLFGAFYPPKMVQRTARWGWTMQNDWAIYGMIGTAVAFRNELEETLSKVPVRDRL